METYQPAKILFVDDNSVDVEIIRRSFENDGFKVEIDHALNAEDALAKLAAPDYELPDIMVIDRFLRGQGISGDELITQLKESTDTNLNHIVLAATSGVPLSTVDAKKFANLGVELYLDKPIPSVVLLQAIKRTKHLFTGIFKRSNQGVAA